jgi:hypothetical protein
MPAGSDKLMEKLRNGCRKPLPIAFTNASFSVHNAVNSPGARCGPTARG